MTSDEYGTNRKDFRGKRIRAIRKHEMREAAKAYGMNPDGTSKVKIIWFGEIDANLPFNRETYLRLQKILIDLKPNIVIGPDSFYSLDLHPDHKHTGWFIYIIIKSMEPAKRPMLLLYHSSKTNFFIPITDFKFQIDVVAKHRSQFNPLFSILLYQFRKLFYYIRSYKSAGIPGEGFRRVNFTKGENEMKGFFHKIVYLFTMTMFKNFREKLCHPTPNELGLLNS